MIKISVGNVVKSVGLGIYREIKIIKTDIAIEIVRKKSNKPLGKGTIIIAIIAIIKPITVKSFALTIVSKKGAIRVSMLFCLGAILTLMKFYVIISLSDILSKKSSILD